MLIVWDEPKRVANLLKHGLDFARLTDGFFLDAMIVAARDDRYKAVGRLKDGGRLVVVVLKPVGQEALSIISMRPANTKERRSVDGEEV
ncbi:MAG: BrnT family toxin [Bauldia sp.]|nr:BrnT family toxin [Bauldia sp.]MCW5718504.1 BrnT family toxin [Bauldia sp.]